MAAVYNTALVSCRDAQPLSDAAHLLSIFTTKQDAFDDDTCRKNSAVKLN